MRTFRALLILAFTAAAHVPTADGADPLPFHQHGAGRGGFNPAQGIIE